MASFDVVDPSFVTADPRRGWLRLAHPRPAFDSVAPTRSITQISAFRMWSVAKVALLFWSCVGVVVVLTSMLAWAILNSMGVVGNLESFVMDMTGAKEFHLMSGPVLSMLALLVVLFVCFASTLTILAAALYNGFARVVGGVEVCCRHTAVPVRTDHSSDGDNQQDAVVRSNGHADGAIVSKS